MTELALRGRGLATCPRRVPRRARASKRKDEIKPRRSLWTRGKGRFRTRGRYGSATVRGTWWLTQDRCDGTLVRVREGVVAVRDIPARRTVTVRAREAYLAKAPRAR